MRYLVTVLALASTLLVVQGCSLIPKTEEKSVAAPLNHDGHSMSHDETPLSGGLNSHEAHSPTETSSFTQAKLTVPKNISANQSVLLTIDIQDQSGKALSKFDTFQEKLMHLIVVSDNFQFFNHLHPVYKGNGRFAVEATFPQAGSYTLFSDYKPVGQSEQISVLKTQVSGKTLPTPKIDLSRSKTFGEYKVNLISTQPKLKAGQEVMLMFDLREAATNQAITDLQPYLGEQGHLVILKQSSPLTKADYIHAHAMKDSPSGHVHFMTKFPRPGKYKLWGQFNRNGKIVTADFWVDVF